MIVRKAVGVVQQLPGACCPVLMLCEGGTHYVVKLAQNPEREKVLIAEWIGYQLAEDLAVPVPGFALIEISDRMAAASQMDFPMVTAGIHFGSEFQAKASTQTGASLLRTAVNTDRIPNIILLDYLMHNRDRADNEGNLLVARGELGWELTAIDFGHSFYAPLWDCDVLCQRKTEFDHRLLDGKVYKRLLPYINGHSPFFPSLSLLERLSSERVGTIIESVPDSWGLRGDQRECLLDFLIERRQRLPAALQKHLRNFMPYWKGGDH